MNLPEENGGSKGTVTATFGVPAPVSSTAVDYSTCFPKIFLNDPGILSMIKKADLPEQLFKLSIMNYQTPIVSFGAHAGK